MAKKRRKRKSAKKTISLPPKAEVKEVIEKRTIEEEMIKEYRDYARVLEQESPSPPELPKTKKIKYLGVDILVMRGPVTGERYRFTAKEPISEVAIEDYEGLLKKIKRARRCCGQKPEGPGRMMPSQPFFGPV